MDGKLLKALDEQGMESLGRYYSKYKAFVADNQDPDKLSRLKLIIPQVTGAEVYDYWAFPCGVFSGMDKDKNGYGFQIIPPKNSLVLVEFENGHPEKPIWSHGYFGQADDATYEKPNEERLTDIKSFWFRSPGGHTVMINDTTGEILAELKTGQSFKITKDAASIIHDKAISLGQETESAEPAVLGKSHNDHEKATLDGIIAITVMTPMGPSSTPINFSTFEQQKTAIEQILSKKNTLD